MTRRKQLQTTQANSAILKVNKLINQLGSKSTAKYKLDPVMEAEISSKIKAANARITQIGKTYGFESSIYKQEVGKFEKGAYQEFIRRTEGKARGKNVQREREGKWTPTPSHIAFDSKKIMDLVRKEGASPRVNTILSELIGVKIVGNFQEHEQDKVPLKLELKEVKGGGVSTTTKIDKQITKRLERLGEDWTQMTKQEIRNRGEMMYEFQENFQTTYETYIAKFGEAEARKDSTIKVLYGEFRGSKKRLTYDELYSIKEKMTSYINEAANDALKFEEENTEELK